MVSVEVNGKQRDGLGKKSSKAVRNEGRIPCVLYGGEDVVHFSTTVSDVKSLIYTPEFKLAELNIDGTTYRSILKDVQFHPVKETIVHIDFLRLVDGHPIKVNLPVEFQGSSPGVKLGGKLQQSLRRVTIKTTPENLVDRLSLDISNLELGHAIRVRDIDAPEGVEIMNPGGTPVATVEVPRALRSAEAAADAAAAAEE